MGQAGRKGSGSALSRWYPQHSREYMHVGDSNRDEANKCHQGQEDTNPNFTHIFIGTREFQKLGDITEELMNDVGTTEVDGESSSCVHDSSENSTGPDG